METEPASWLRAGVRYRLRVVLLSDLLAAGEVAHASVGVQATRRAVRSYQHLASALRLLVLLLVILLQLRQGLLLLQVHLLL